MSAYKLKRSELITHAVSIAHDYAAQGLTLTLRQLYYQFVSRGLEISSQKAYNRLGAALAKARYDGLFPIDAIEDRGRSAGLGDWTTNDDDVAQALEDSKAAINHCPFWYLSRSRWFGQPKIVSVWVEKEALSGVFEDPCRKLGVPLFACKGYPSISTLYEWHKMVVRARDAIEAEGYQPPTPVILYFGDHDPEGLDIPRAATESIKKIQDLDGEYYDFELERCALNMDQIERYNPPPFWAKESSSRYEGYVEQTGTVDCWELDALEPSVLRDLITERTAAHFDDYTHKVNNEEIEHLRDELREEIRAMVIG